MATNNTRALNILEVSASGRRIDSKGGSYSDHWLSDLQLRCSGIAKSLDRYGRKGAADVSVHRKRARGINEEQKGVRCHDVRRRRRRQRR